MIRRKCDSEDCSNMIGYKGFCFDCQCKQKLKRIQEMTYEQISEKLAYISNNMEEDIIEKEFLPIICNHNVKSDDCIRAAFKENIFRPGIIYKDAPDDVRDKVIERLEEDENIAGTVADKLLLILAWIGDKVVQEKFIHWTKNPLKWRGRLHIDPLAYAEEAGWTINEDGQREDLYFQTAYQVVRGDIQNEKSLRIAQFEKELCENCGSNLCTILELDLSDSRLMFLGMNQKIKNLICLSCTPWTPSFCKFDEAGQAELYKTIYTEGGYLVDAEGVEEISNNTFVLDKVTVSPYHSAYWNLPSFFCQIGGLPGWIDDAVYAECPDCGKKMKFFAQFGLDNIEHSEGILYFEICTECRIIATFYQQT